MAPHIMLWFSHKSFAELQIYLSISHVSQLRYIEDICFFEVNTKYISSSELKTSEFSRVRSTSENYYVFNSRETANFLFILYNAQAFSNAQGRQ